MSEGRLLDYLEHMQQAYFDINLDVVWETIQTALPELLNQLPAVRQDAADKNSNSNGMAL